jgi:hypothetical protein
MSLLFNKGTANESDESQRRRKDEGKLVTTGFVKDYSTYVRPETSSQMMDRVGYACNYPNIGEPE